MPRWPGRDGWAKFRKGDLSKREVAVTAARVAPWVVFGPITGVLSERAFRCFRDGHPFLGVLYLVLNIEILVAIPTLTGIIAAS